MDKATVKLLLGSYRPQDAHDPVFAEALRAVAADPELAAWFEEMQRFDAMMCAKFHEAPVPADVKSHILLGYGISGHLVPPRRAPFWIVVGSIAAILVLSLLSWHFFPLRERPMSRLTTQAISYTDQMPPLQFVCFDASAVADWINKQPGARTAGVSLPPPPKTLSMAMIGSSVIEWKGRPVVMVCLQNGKRMAMLYILKADGSEQMQEGATETVQNSDWVVRTTKANGEIRILTTKGRPEDLNFQSPF